MLRNSKKYAYLALSTICVAQIIWVGVGWNTLPLYAAPITEEWGISRSAYMITISLVAVCLTVVSMLVFGRLIEKLGFRRLIVVGGVLCTSAFLVFSFAQNLVMLYITGVFFGTGCALIGNNAMNTVCITWFKKNTGAYLSFASTLGSVSGILAASGVAALIVVFGWRPSLLIIAALSFVGMIVCLLLYKGSPQTLGVLPLGAHEKLDQSDDLPDEAEKIPNQSSQNAQAVLHESGPSYSAMLKSAKFWALAFVMVIVGLVGYAILATIPLLVGDFGFPELSGIALSLALAASAICLIPFGWVLDKFGSRTMIVICFGLLIIAMLIMLFIPMNAALIYVVAALIGAAYDMGLTAPGIVVMDAFGRRDYAKKMGIINGCCYAGIALGPTVMSLFYDLGSGSYNTAFIVFIALAVLASFMVYPLANRKKVLNTNA